MTLPLRPAGERAVVIDTGAHAAGVALAARELAERLDIDLSEVVPGAASVLIQARNPQDLQRFLASAAALRPMAADDDVSATVEIATRYEGPDLRDVADATGMTVEEVIRRHSAVTYEAAFTGFAPGFAYLSGLDAGLRLPRRSSPRPRVPPGSVAIADGYSAVYPRASPGGWHLLGSTDAVIFDAAREPAPLIAPGARVRFVALT